MKRSILLLIPFLFLISCGTQRYLSESSDPYKKTENVRLVQDLLARSAEVQPGLISRLYYNVNTDYLFELDQTGKGKLTLDLKMQTPVSTNVLDSIIFLDLEGEQFRMVSTGNKYREFLKSADATSTSVENSNEKEKTVVQTKVINNNYQMMSSQFDIPESLWISIANAQAIKYRIYLGNAGYDIILTQPEMKRLKYFLGLVICKRDAKQPPLPADYKKW